MQIGELFAERYRILSKIGSGGMADVFLADDTTLNRQIAIKALYKQYATQDDFVSRFRHEAQAAASLNHPNIVSIYDWGQQKEAYYIAMEYIRGRNLKALIKDHAPFKTNDGLKLVLQVCSALQHAHKAGIIHRDVKPHNIIVTDDGDVKVTDFGIARMMGSDTQITQTGMVLGTAHYISPEQARGFQARPVSDIYSLGVVMYEMFTGKLPFDADNPVAVAIKHTQDAPTPPRIINPDIPETLERIILKAMAKSPELRYQDVSDLREDIRKFIKGIEVVVEIPYEDDEPTILMQHIDRIPPGKRPAPQKDEKINWAAWISLIIFLLIVAGSVSYLTFSKLMPKTVDVPTLIGKTESAALKSAEQNKLRINVTTREPHDIVPSGQVISQNPDAGTEVKEDSVIEIVVSTGKPQISVPEVIGLTEVQATRALLELGLDVGEIEKQYSSIEEGTVIDQDPKPGGKVEKKTKINLIVSSGIATIGIPDVIGMNQELAARVLLDKKLKIAVQTENSETVTTGDAIRSIPSPGTLVEEGSTVTVVFSAGIKLYKVPNVIELTTEEARQKLEAEGFTVDEEALETDDSNLWGKVIEQSPSEGISVPKGTNVTIKIGQAPIGD